MTNSRCGRTLPGYFTAVIDACDRVLLDWSAAFPYGRDEDDPTVTCRHDNDTQFTSVHYRGVAKALDFTLSRTAYRHTDAGAFIERMFRTLKKGAVWPNEFDTRDPGLESILAWMMVYTIERPHDSLHDRTPAEARAEAAQRKTVACPSTTTGVTTHRERSRRLTIVEGDRTGWRFVGPRQKRARVSRLSASSFHTAMCRSPASPAVTSPGVENGSSVKTVEAKWFAPVG